jgi:hypothetical protein
VVSLLLLYPFPRNMRKAILVFTYKTLNLSMGARGRLRGASWRRSGAPRGAGQQGRRCHSKALATASAPPSTTRAPHLPTPPPPVGGMTLVNFSLAISGIPLLGESPRPGRPRRRSGSPWPAPPRLPPAARPDPPPHPHPHPHPRPQPLDSINRTVKATKALAHSTGLTQEMRTLLLAKKWREERNFWWGRGCLGSGGPGYPGTSGAPRTAGLPAPDDAGYRHPSNLHPRIGVMGFTMWVLLSMLYVQISHLIRMEEAADRLEDELADARGEPRKVRGPAAARRRRAPP